MSSRRRRGETLGLAGLAAAVVTAVGWFLGLDGPGVLLIGVAAAVCVGFRLAPETSDDDVWPRHDEAAADRGIRPEVKELSWALQGPESRVEPGSVARLQTLASRRLARHGLDLSSAADAGRIRARVGEPAYRLLTAEPGVRVGVDAYLGSVAAVEALGPEAPVSEVVR